jgi:hypothetical protein
MNAYHLLIISRAVAIASALPLLALGGWSDPLKHTVIAQIFPHSALGLFILSLSVWSGLFVFLHMKGAATRLPYLLCGLALGAFPSIIYLAVCQLTSQVRPPLSLTLGGVVAGLLAGLILYRESRIRQYG